MATLDLILKILHKPLVRIWTLFTFSILAVYVLMQKTFGTYNPTGKVVLAINSSSLSYLTWAIVTFTLVVFAYFAYKTNVEDKEEVFA